MYEEKMVEIDPELKKSWKEEFGFENPVVIKNPYLDKLNEEVTLHMPTSTLDYFKKLSEETELSLEQVMVSVLNKVVSTH